MSPATFGLPDKMTSTFRNAYTVNVTAVELQTASGANSTGGGETETITLHYVANIA